MLRKELAESKPKDYNEMVEPSLRLYEQEYKNNRSRVIDTLSLGHLRMLFVACGDGNVIFERKLQIVNGERARLEKIRDDLLNKLQKLEGEILTLDSTADQYIELQNRMEDTKHQLLKKGVMKP
jgi:hypothetical protein